MKQSKKIIILLTVLVLLLAAAWFLYGKLSENFSPELPEQTTLAKEDGLEKADDFTVDNISGESVKLSGFFGKPIVLNFWSTRCGPCKVELPDFDELYQMYGDDVVFMMVNLTDGYWDTRSSVEKFLSDTEYTFPVYFDMSGEATDKYRVYSIPQTVIIDENGAVYNKHIGILSKEKLDTYIKDLLP